MRVIKSFIRLLFQPPLLFELFLARLLPDNLYWVRVLVGFP